jgi:hypothetical protein
MWDMFYFLFGGARFGVGVGVGVQGAFVNAAVLVLKVKRAFCVLFPLVGSFISEWIWYRMTFRCIDDFMGFFCQKVNFMTTLDYRQSFSLVTTLS